MGYLCTALRWQRIRQDPCWRERRSGAPAKGPASEARVYAIRGHANERRNDIGCTGNAGGAKVSFELSLKWEKCRLQNVSKRCFVFDPECCGYGSENYFQDKSCKGVDAYMIVRISKKEKITKRYERNLNMTTKTKLTVIDGETLMDMKLPPTKFLCRNTFAAGHLYARRRT